MSLVTFKPVPPLNYKTNGNTAPSSRVASQLLLGNDQLQLSKRFGTGENEHQEKGLKEAKAAKGDSNRQVEASDGNTQSSTPTFSIDEDPKAALEALEREAADYKTSRQTLGDS